MVDSTESKWIQERLREAEAKYRTLVEQIPAVTYTAATDEQGSTLYVSPQVERIFGFSPAEWLADPALWAKQLHPDDRERVLAEYQGAVAGGRPFRSEYRLLRRDGGVIWVHDEGTFIRDPAGRPLYIHGVVFDVTDRKRAEEALQESQARLSAAVENFPFDFWARDQAGRLVLQNPVSEARWGDLSGKFPHESGITDEILAVWQDSTLK